MLSGHPSFTKVDMPVPANFRSDDSELRLYLIPVEHEKGPEGEIMRKPNTGLRVRFERGRASISNRATLKLMIEHSKFNSSTKGGYRIDPEDASGFWRAMGYVKEVTIKTFEDIPMVQVEMGSLDFGKLKNIPADVKPLANIERVPANGVQTEDRYRLAQ